MSSIQQPDFSRPVENIVIPDLLNEINSLYVNARQNKSNFITTLRKYNSDNTYNTRKESEKSRFENKFNVVKDNLESAMNSKMLFNTENEAIIKNNKLIHDYKSEEYSATLGKLLAAGLISQKDYNQGMLKVNFISDFISFINNKQSEFDNFTSLDSKLSLIDQYSYVYRDYHDVYVREYAERSKIREDLFKQKESIESEWMNYEQGYVNLDYLLSNAVNSITVLIDSGSISEPELTELNSKKTEILSKLSSLQTEHNTLNNDKQLLINDIDDKISVLTSQVNDFKSKANEVIDNLSNSPLGFEYNIGIDNQISVERERISSKYIYMGQQDAVAQEIVQLLNTSTTVVHNHVADMAAHINWVNDGYIGNLFKNNFNELVNYVNNKTYGLGLFDNACNKVIEYESLKVSKQTEKLQLQEQIEAIYAEEDSLVLSIENLKSAILLVDPLSSDYLAYVEDYESQIGVKTSDLKSNRMASNSISSQISKLSRVIDAIDGAISYCYSTISSTTDQISNAQNQYDIKLDEVLLSVMNNSIIFGEERANQNSTPSEIIQMNEFNDINIKKAESEYEFVRNSYPYPQIQ